jgi:hypothetical protein
MPLIGEEYMAARSLGNKDIMAEKHPRNDGNVQSLCSMKTGEFEYKYKLSKTRLAEVFQFRYRSSKTSMNFALWTMRIRQLLLMLLDVGELVFVRSSKRILEEEKPDVFGTNSFQSDEDKQCFKSGILLSLSTSK